ncbi:MAG: hypothetical protein ABFD89_20565 [Bryobacteraceae bacterium]
MSGWLSPGFPPIGVFTGAETIAPVDTQASGGVAPQSASSTLMQLATAFKWLNASADKTTVAGTRYYGSYAIGSPTLLTGIEVLVGGTGGTDNWIFELHDSTGALVATTATAGTTAGTANTWQRIAFTSTYQAAAGTYYIAVQSNGTTAKPAVFSSPGLPIVSGSASGTFGTGAAITPPTTYTASLAPVALVY